MRKWIVISLSIALCGNLGCSTGNEFGAFGSCAVWFRL